MMRSLRVDNTRYCLLWPVPAVAADDGTTVFNAEHLQNIYRTSTEHLHSTRFFTTHHIRPALDMQYMAISPWSYMITVLEWHSRSSSGRCRAHEPVSPMQRLQEGRRMLDRTLLFFERSIVQPRQPLKVSSEPTFNGYP
jgi:hypothetical protein